MRFIASADWQLGKQALFLPLEARVRYAQARLDAIHSLGEIAADVEADFVVVGGDVFESNQLDRAIVGRALEVLRGFSIPVYLLPGNHDPLDAASIYDSAVFRSSCPKNVHVLRTVGLAASVPCRDGTVADIYAAPWFSKDPREDLVARTLAMLANANVETDPRVRILVGHGNVSTLQANRDALDVIDVENLESAIEAGHLDFAVLGDRHGLYEVRDRIWYPGTPEVTAEREINPGNVLEVNIDPQTHACEVITHRVGTWEFRVIDAELTGIEDIETLLATLDRIDDKARTSVKLALSGVLTIRQNAHLEEELGHRADLFARLEYWTSHTDLVVMPAEGDFSGLSLSGFARDALEQLEKMAADGDTERAASARDAVGLLYRLSGAGQ